MTQGVRFYRNHSTIDRWSDYRVKVETTDLMIRSTTDMKEKVTEDVISVREMILSHIDIQAEFLTSYKPVKKIESASNLIQTMYRASEAAGVGPMASVAGTIAEYVGQQLIKDCNEIIIENGGDIWTNLQNPAAVHIFPGNIHFKQGIALSIKPENTPCGISTSSSRIGTSFSFGRADTATVICRDAALSDALATEVCNMVQDENDLTAAADFAISRGATGVVVIFRDHLAVKGDIELTEARKEQ